MAWFSSHPSKRRILLYCSPLLLLGLLGLLALRNDDEGDPTSGPNQALTQSNNSPITIKLEGSGSLPADASHDLHPSLASFSIETAFFETFVGNVTSPNVLTRHLLDNLKNRTGVPAEIRIGGITADSTYWNETLGTSSLNFIDTTGALHNTTIGPGWWESIGLLPEGTKVTMNLVSTSSTSLVYHGELRRLTCVMNRTWKI